MNNLVTRLSTPLGIALLAVAFGACTSDPQTPEDPRLSAGDATIMEATSGAFTAPAPCLTAEHVSIHNDGDAAFEALFVQGGPINPGLGPIFNNTSCLGCHIQDGRGTPPAPNEQMSSMLLRVSIPGGEPNGAPLAVPGFGGQLQPRHIWGVKGEGTVVISYTEEVGTLADNTQYTLRKPTYTITDPYIPLPGNVMISPRVAPIVFGLGMLEAVPEATILSFADENDRNGDGISGRPNYVDDAIKGGRSIGRFGLKANNPSLVQQAAGAYNQDMGITSWLFPIESARGQAQDNGSTKYDVDSATVFAAAFYTQTLGVPSRRNLSDPDVPRGEKIFEAARCAKCHIPSMTTGTYFIAELSSQKIHPYTDLLLHDMGDGLADNRPDFMASGREWRTSPLWGIGLTSIASGHTNFLHDGRARNLTEAIMWHGGEGEFSREYFRTLSTADRSALLKFIQSL